MPEDLSTGELVTLALKRAGTQHIFTLNGGHIWGVLMGAVEHDIGLVDVRHEQTAAFAAEAWSKLTRTCGVAAVTAGPGVTNTVSAIAGAWGNDSPLLVIGGRSPLSTEGMGSLQELDHRPIVSTITKSARTAQTAEEVYPMVAEALALASAPRSGPTYVDIPADVFFGGAPAPAHDGAAPPRLEGPDPDEVLRAVEVLRRAERPAIVAGTGIWWGRGEEELVRLAEALDAPVVLNGLARGMLPPGHRLAGTRGRKIALGEADAIVVAGAPLDFRLGFGGPPVFADSAQIVYVDCDSRRRHRAAAAELDGDVAQSLGDLARALEGSPRHEQWVERVRVAVEESRRRDAEMAASDSRPIHPARVVSEVARRLDPDAIVIGDGGDFVSFAGRLIESPQPGCFLDPGPYGCLGTGAGYAMAARLAHPDRQVVLFNGDGAFGFSAMDFDSLVRHRLPVVCVIGNNGIWATEKHPMEDMLGTSIAADLRPGVRYDQVVTALGGHGELVDDPDEVGPAFERALKAGVPAVINVITDPAAKYPRSAALL
jgi:acetolactate synthase-1/2/3 large subunit